MGHAQIYVEGKGINCVVRDLSNTGAKLGVSRRAHLPSSFILCFVQRKLKFRVRLRWREGDFAGVSFDPQPALQSPSRKSLILDA